MQPLIGIAFQKLRVFLQIRDRADFSTAHIVENLGNLASQIPAMYDSVDKSVLEQELAGLKAFWQLHTHRLLDHLGASEANQGLWLSHHHIAHESETSGNTAHGWIS